MAKPRVIVNFFCQGTGSNGSNDSTDLGLWPFSVVYEHLRDARLVLGPDLLYAGTKVSLRKTAASELQKLSRRLRVRNIPGSRLINKAFPAGDQRRCKLIRDMVALRLVARVEFPKPGSASGLS